MGTNEIVNRLKVTKYITSTKDNQTIIDEAEIEGSNPVDAGSGENSVMIDAYGNEANGEASVALGKGVQANNDAESAFGKYNKSNEGTIHSVGVGEDDDHRENAFEILEDGSVYVKGIGGYTGANPLPGTNDLQTIVGGLKQFTYVFTDTLPEASEDTMYIIYFIPAPTPAQQNNKDEYLTVDNGDGANPRYTWEQIGSATVDLSAYSTTAEMNAAIAAAVPWEAAVGTGSVIVKGSGNVADNNYEVATGVYNKSNTGTQFSVGIGTGTNDRKNAFEVMSNGDVYVKGIGTYNGTNPSTGTNDLKTVVAGKANTTDVPWQKGTGSDSALLKGSSSTAGGAGAVAEGSATVATGTYSHTEGRQTTTTATGEYAHAEGYLSEAQQAYSHAEGFTSVAGGPYSHAEGAYAQTTHPYEHAEGIYNKSNIKNDGTADENKAGTTQMSVGVGTSNSSRANAVEVMQNGDVYVKGIGGYDGTNAGASGVKTLQELAGGNVKVLTKAEYDSIQKDPDIVYVVSEPASIPNGVYIAYTDGSISNYDTLDSGKTPVGVCLITSNVGIVIHPNEITNIYWGPTETLVSGITTTQDREVAKTDFAGEENTNAVKNAGNAYPAFYAAYNAVYSDGREGYLPSLGELEEIRLNATEINVALNLIPNANLLRFNAVHYWASTQASNDTAWRWAFNTSPARWNEATKTSDHSSYGSCACRSVAKYDKDSGKGSTKLYQGTYLIASSETIDSVTDLESTVTNLQSSVANKADKVATPTAGHLVKVNASGGLLDAGLAMVKLTKPEYEALAVKDPSTMYLVTPAGVFIGYTDGSLSNYDTLDSGKTPVGVVLINDNVSFVINPQRSGEVDWGPADDLISGVVTTDNEQTALLDFNGKQNTDAAIAHGLTGMAVNAARAAVFADSREGYLPSCGEFEQLRPNVAAINTALGLLNSNFTITFEKVYDQNYWTSTQYSKDKGWRWASGFPMWQGLSKAYHNGTYALSFAEWPKDGTKIYLGSTLIADSNLPSDIASILATI